MRWIKKVVRSEKRLYNEKIPYYLHTYLIEDDLGNEEEVQSTNLFDEGENVRVWFNDKYNQVKLMKGNKNGKHQRGRNETPTKNDREIR